MVFLWHYKALTFLLMPDLFSAADPIWQYKFDAKRSSYACASAILFDGFDIFRVLHHLIWHTLAGICQI